MLRLRGFDARSITDAHEALLAAQSEAPDLLISEVMLRTFSLRELAGHIRECKPGCKVLLFSRQLATEALPESDETEWRHYESSSPPLDLLKLDEMECEV
jgi:DNA-binding NtrC family response regulator